MPITPSSSDAPLAHTPPPPVVREPLQPLAALLAFVLPGLGHVFLGYTKRGILIFAGVMGLFVSGLFIGGIDVVDREEDFVWFLGQGLVGPTALAVDYVHQRNFKVFSPVERTWRSAKPGEFRNPITRTPVPISIDTSGRTSADIRDASGALVRTVSPAYPPNVKSLGRMNELGTLFTTIAGFMNLIAIIDALWHVPKPRRRTQGAENLPTTLKRVPQGGAA